MYTMALEVFLVITTVNPHEDQLAVGVSKSNRGLGFRVKVSFSKHSLLGGPGGLSK